VMRFTVQSGTKAAANLSARGHSLAYAARYLCLLSSIDPLDLAGHRLTP
jgi:hypothetical protein